MTAPLLSGFCNPGNPAPSHRRCELDGCTCYCHAPQTAQVTPPPGNMPPLPGDPPRVKVLLSCLQGQHTATCGHAPDGLTPAGYTPPLDGLELTLEERRRIIAAHMILDPQAALDTAAAIVSERMHP